MGTCQTLCELYRAKVFTFLGLLSFPCNAEGWSIDNKTYGLPLTHKRYSVHRDNHFFRARVDQQPLTHGAARGQALMGAVKCHRAQDPLFWSVGFANCNESEQLVLSFIPE